MPPYLFSQQAQTKEEALINAVYKVVEDKKLDTNKPYEIKKNDKRISVGIYPAANRLIAKTFEGDSTSFAERYLKVGRESFGSNPEDVCEDAEFYGKGEKIKQRQKCADKLAEYLNLVLPELEKQPRRQE